MILVPNVRFLSYSAFSFLNLPYMMKTLCGNNFPSLGQTERSLFFF